MTTKIENPKLDNIKEVVIPVILVWAVMFILSAILYVFSPKSAIASYTVAFFYTIWVAASLNYALKNGGFDSLKLPGKRWIIATLAGIAIGILSVIGNNQTPEFKNATLITLPFLSLLTLTVKGSIAAFCEVIMVMGYYHFRLEKAFGAVIAVIITAITWTTYHVLLLSSPGSIPSTSEGVLNFIIGIFIGSLIITVVTSLTKSILTALFMNLISNIFINWLRISVSPQDVLIADNSFPVIGVVLAIAYVVGIAYVRKKTLHQSTAS